MIATPQKPDCIAIRYDEALRFACPDETVHVRHCCHCGTVVGVVDETVAWEHALKREARYGCDVCYEPSGELKETSDH